MVSFLVGNGIDVMCLYGKGYGKVFLKFNLAFFECFEICIIGKNWKGVCVGMLKLILYVVYIWRCDWLGGSWIGGKVWCLCVGVGGYVVGVVCIICLFFYRKFWGVYSGRVWVFFVFDVGSLVCCLKRGVFVCYWWKIF